MITRLTFAMSGTTQHCLEIGLSWVERIGVSITLFLYDRYEIGAGLRSQYIYQGRSLQTLSCGLTGIIVLRGAGPAETRSCGVAGQPESPGRHNCWSAVVGRTCGHSGRSEGE